MNINWKHKSVKKLVGEYEKSIGANPIEIIQFLSRELVLKAFTKEWKGPPFDIIELAKMLDMEVMPNELVTDARISPKEKGRYLIEYNPFRPSTRINFSLAHEIGHSLFSDCAETIRYRSKELEEHSWELEFLCNVAAAEVLLPYAKFSNDANEVPLTLDSLKMLANKYQASLESVFIRFCEVVDKSCMVLLTRFNNKEELELEYDIKSNHCKIELNDRFIVPKDSKAYECIKSGWTSHNLEQWAIFGETRYRVYAIGLPALRKYTEPRVGIFLVPEFYDETSSHEIYTVNGDATEPRGEGKKIIAQVVNTSIGTGMGFGKAMATKFPGSKKALEQWKTTKKGFGLGETQIVQLTDATYVAHMVAQHGIFPKYGEVPLKYPSLQKCLVTLREKAKELGASVHMPLIGAGQAKGDWELIKGMIFQELVKNNIEVTVYVLPNSKQEKKRTTTALELFDENSFV